MITKTLIIMIFGGFVVLSLVGLTYMAMVVFALVKTTISFFKSIDFAGAKAHARFKMYGDEKIGWFKKMWLNVATILYIQSQIDYKSEELGKVINKRGE